MSRDCGKIMCIDSTFCKTDLCIIGSEMNTDKSPFALDSPCCQHRKGYTAVYSLLFQNIRMLV